MEFYEEGDNSSVLLVLCDAPQQMLFGWDLVKEEGGQQQPDANTLNNFRFVPTNSPEPLTWICALQDIASQQADLQVLPALPVDDLSEEQGEKKSSGTSQQLGQLRKRKEQKLEWNKKQRHKCQSRDTTTE